MVEVICDTNFVIQLATKRIKNLDNVNMEIGQLTFVVPQVVKNELIKLYDDPLKKEIASTTLKFIKNLKILPIDGNYADKSILEYIKNNSGIVATLDKELKILLKQNGGSIISLSNNKIVLES